MTDDAFRSQINPGYALNQLLRALQRGPEGAARAQRWSAVVEGLRSGRIRAGSRAPVGQAPPWITLEVVTGGFATGAFSAGGAPQPHEVDLQTALEVPRTEARGALNAWFLSDHGQEWLRDRLETGCYRINVPEEGALLSIAWLLAQGEGERAESILTELAPWSRELRLYPVPAPGPRSGGGVSLRTTGEVVGALRATKPKAEVEAMREAVRVWAPLAARAVALFQDLGSATWAERARALLEDHRKARTAAPLCTKVDDPKENYARLRALAEKALSGPLTEGEKRGAARIVANYVAKHGSPGTAEHAVRVAQQLRAVEAPPHAELARQLAARLAPLPQDEGLPDADTHAQGLPEHLATKVRRALEAPVATLVERKILQSSEAIATLLPREVGTARAEAIADPRLRRLYVELYTAFRRRRSLLLLDLASQVRLQELPWVSALAPWLEDSNAFRRTTRDFLAASVSMVLQAFPQTVTPNRLVKEWRALAAAAHLQLPLVEELAADIFIGTFSPGFVRSAQVAARVLGGTLYERYYGLPFAEVLALRLGDDSRDSPEFAELCARLAPRSTERSSPVARNGTVIEQAQLLTAHNLAALIDALHLRGALDWPQLAQRCFAWVCARQQRKLPRGRPQLRSVKNCAYAWRQMVVFLALSKPTEVDGFLQRAWAHLATQPEPLRTRLAAALTGLSSSARGEPVDSRGGRRFLGWSVGPHWLLG